MRASMAEAISVSRRAEASRYRSDASLVACPMRAISSLTEAPELAAVVLARLRRS